METNIVRIDRYALISPVQPDMLPKYLCIHCKERLNMFRTYDDLITHMDRHHTLECLTDLVRNLIGI